MLEIQLQLFGGRGAGSDRKPTAEQNSAVEWYVSGDGMWINDALRGRAHDGYVAQIFDEDRQFINDLDKATNREHGYDTLYRSVDASAIFGGGLDIFKFGDLQTMLWNDADGRKSNKYEEAMRSVVNKAKGKVITEKGFLSTTKKASLAEEFGDFTGSEMPVVIEFKKAKKIKGYDLKKHNPNLEKRMYQEEVLLQRNTKYKVNDVKWVNGTVRVFAEFV